MLIALEELVPRALPVHEKTLAPDYPYHAVRGTVGLWSRHRLTDARRIDQVMARSAAVGHIRTLPATGSDHLPIAARIALG